MLASLGLVPLGVELDQSPNYRRLVNLFNNTRSSSKGQQGSQWDKLLNIITRGPSSYTGSSGYVYASS
jgi:hypothetical protein